MRSRAGPARRAIRAPCSTHGRAGTRCRRPSISLALSVNFRPPGRMARRTLAGMRAGFSTAEVDCGDRIEYRRAMVRRHFVALDMEPATAGAFTGSVALRSIDDLDVARVQPIRSGSRARDATSIAPPPASTSSPCTCGGGRRSRRTAGRRCWRRATSRCSTVRGPTPPASTTPGRSSMSSCACPRLASMRAPPAWTARRPSPSAPERPSPRSRAARASQRLALHPRLHRPLRLRPA